MKGTWVFDIDLGGEVYLPEEQVKKKVRRMVASSEGGAT
jgi:hypothetical protein